MPFSEVLARERKSRGMSQEDLAARIQVSRQAVSKWETGDAMPDLNKLLALADALEISLDVLCGRETCRAAAAGPAETAAPSGRQRLWPVLCGVLAVCLMAGGLWSWSRRNIVPSETAQAWSALPELFEVSGVKFWGGGAPDCLQYQFIPSAINDAYTYQITFTDAEGTTQSFDAACQGGVCAGTVTVSQLRSYTVTAVVSAMGESRAALLAYDLTFDETSAGYSAPSE